MTAPLYPDVRAHLAARAATPLATGTPQQAREARRTGPAKPGVPVAAVEPVVLRLPGRVLDARRYRPACADAGAVGGTVVFFHGGGFVTGDLDTHDQQARMLAARTGWVVVSVAYRLAPEHPFPAAFDDAVDAVEHLAGEGGPVAVAGSSAGANLAAGAARALAATPLAPCAQLLVYPLLRDQPSAPARRRLAAGPGLDDATLRWYLGHYLASPTDRTDPRFDPTTTALAGLAPAVIAVAGHDPLYDDGRLYARLLADAGVEVVLHDHPRLPHAFWGMSTTVPTARAAADAACTAFARLLRPAIQCRTHSSGTMS